MGVAPPERALALRTLAMELERIHSHMLVAAVMAEIIGLQSLFMIVMRDREIVMHMKELLTGNRVVADYVWPSGVRRDLGEETRKRLLEKAAKLRPRLMWLREVYSSHPVLLRRLEGVGKISRGEATAWGLMGPTLRASGVAYDARTAYPYAWYGEVKPRVVTRSEGDSLARMLVRIDEALESLRIVEEILENLPGGPVRGLRFPPRVVRPGEAISRVEAPRGMLLYHVVSRGGRQPYRVRIRTPSFPNVLNSLFAYRGATLADVPVILTSFDPCISCMERVVVVDEERGEERLVRFRDLARGKGAERGGS